MEFNKGFHPMLRGKSKLRLFLIAVICLSVPAFSAYLHYNDLIEADFLSHTLTFENADLGDTLWVEQPDPLMVCGLDGLSTLFPAEEDIFHQEDDLVSPESVTSERTSVLRC